MLLLCTGCSHLRKMCTGVGPRTVRTVLAYGPLAAISIGLFIAGVVPGTVRKLMSTSGSPGLPAGLVTIVFSVLNLYLWVSKCCLIPC